MERGVNCGAIYCATRKPAYLVLAANSARSFRCVAPNLPITLFTNLGDLPKEIRAAFTDVRTTPSPDRITEPDWANGLLDKIESIKASPYARTLFIDADTLVHDKAVQTVFDQLESKDILITECAPDASRSRQMMGRPIYSTGILAYRKNDAVRALLQNWFTLALRYLGLVQAGQISDIPGVDRLTEAEARFLALTDQFSLAQLLAPDRSPDGLVVECLGEEWNFRGDGKRKPARRIVIDHQESIRMGKRSFESPAPKKAGKDNFIAAFATPIFLRHYADTAELNDTLAETIRQMAHSQQSSDRFRSHQGGFYSDDSFFRTKLPGVERLERLVQHAVTDYIREVEGPNAPTLRVDLSAWVALTRAGDYQAPHVHGGATLSGIYYVEVPDVTEPQGCIDLLSPLEQQEMSFLKRYSKTHCRVCPKVGDLLIFPAYCKHFVHPFTGADDRIAVVFNATVYQQRLGRQ